MNPYALTLLFIGSAVIGYFLIRNVPSLLHTPLMSGMNALSGITLIGGLIAAAKGSLTLAVFAIILAAINVAGGFGVTDRMLAMFKSGKEKAQ
ncbi:MAG: NAD(P) transhydrogenase subunit alpha [Lentisphaerae bacterium]|jgi:NAD(P) transhydrogenase subunit alpha|nr:NAD(P) transhydrogenase subunit alpha [Lentisphaerota bacterium]